MPELDQVLQRSGSTPVERGYTVANLRNAASQYEDDFLRNRRQPAALAALRFYAAAVGLVPPSDTRAPFDLLHSARLYCGIGCPAKAQGIVRDLRSNYSVTEQSISVALAACR